MTFVDDNGRRFTALRAYFLPRGATRTGDPGFIPRMATADGGFDLRDLQDVADSHFDKRTLRTRFPGLLPHDTYASFSQTLYTRLGIGANGDGTKAMRLLARIQAGHPVRTVDGLYKSMVLEEPSTYRRADEALDHFKDLDDAYRSMETDGHKAKALAPIASLYADYEASTAKRELIDTLGASRPGDTPFLLWSYRTERTLLEDTTARNRATAAINQVRYEKARDAEKGHDAAIKRVQRQRRENGGDVLEEIKAQLICLADDRDDALKARARFDDRIQVLGVSIRAEAEFAREQTTAELFPTILESEAPKLESERADAYAARGILDSQIKDLRDEHKSLSEREGLVPAYLHNARMTVATAVGLSPQELPFVAELMDMAAGQEEWRLAAEVTLGSFARTMLMDASVQGRVRRTIDGLRLPVRLNFDGADLVAYHDLDGDPRYISGRLIFKDSPFAAWVQDKVQSRGVDHLCVSSPEQLGGSEPKVTVNGQTSHGRRGAHGWNERQKPIIGFSNEARLREIEAEIADLAQDRGVLTERANLAGQQLSKLRARETAYQYLRDTDWSGIDVEGVEERIVAKEQERDRILSNSDLLQALEEEEEQLTGLYDQAMKDRHLAEDEQDRLEAEQKAFGARLSEVAGDLGRLEAIPAIQLPAAQVDYLTGAFETLGDTTGFLPALARLKSYLEQEADRARDGARRSTDALIRIFEAYRDRWPDPNLGVALASYPDYLLILDDIVGKGLYEKRQEWKRHLAEWSGQDLTLLNAAYETSIEDIEERLIPVNDILSSLPFGAGRDRLRIDLRRLNRDDFRRFRAELRDLASDTTAELTDDETEKRFVRLRAFMQRLGKTDSTTARGPSTRDDLLDVRRHIEITASRHTADGREVSTYSALGGKSGGESQELVAFIVGAALRFQLGDESRTRPRFAPVFLDEGFVKSDSEFAGRSVAAWKGLGFQLIIGAPLDKVTALEPSMDLTLCVTKDNQSGYSYISPLASPTSNQPVAHLPAAAG